jgi:hypothetical protein
VKLFYGMRKIKVAIWLIIMVNGQKLKDDNGLVVTYLKIVARHHFQKGYSSILFHFSWVLEISIATRDGPIWNVKKFNNFLEYLSVLYRHEWDQSFLVPVPVRKKFRPDPDEKKFWSRSRREKVLGLGPFRNKFWYRSQSKIFWSRSRSKKEIWSRSRPRSRRDHFAHL